ncbi:MAG: hypothetical protein AAF986_06225 [Pseudomonadota bacterium]
MDVPCATGPTLLGPTLLGPVLPGAAVGAFLNRHFGVLDIGGVT